MNPNPNPNPNPNSNPSPTPSLARGGEARRRGRARRRVGREGGRVVSDHADVELCALRHNCVAVHGARFGRGHSLAQHGLGSGLLRLLRRGPRRLVGPAAREVSFVEYLLAVAEAAFLCGRGCNPNHVGRSLTLQRQQPYVAAA